VPSRGYEEGFLVGRFALTTKAKSPTLPRATWCCT
jgi:hypothetical protein